MINFIHTQGVFNFVIEAPGSHILKNWLKQEFGSHSDLFKFAPGTVIRDPDLMINISGEVIYVKGPLSKRHKPWLYWPKQIAREIESPQVNYSYVGSIENGNEQVCVVSTNSAGVQSKDLLNLEDSLKLSNHSPDGFSWGYSGSGPAQLALAILLHEFQNPYLAIKNYQDFKNDIVSNWDKNSSFAISSKEIREWRKLGISWYLFS